MGVPSRFLKLGVFGSVVLSGLVSLPSCGGGGGGGGSNRNFFVSFASPATPFRFPLPGEAGFQDNSVITLEFTSGADPASIFDETSVNGLSSSVRFTDAAGIRVPAQTFLGGLDAKGQPPVGMDLSADGLQVLRIIADSDGDLATKESFGVPTNPMSLQVTVVVREGAKSVGGGPLIRGFCSTYLIGLTSANPPPRVISVNPTQNSIEVALVESIRVTFSEEVNPLSVIGVSNDPAFPINIRLRGQQQLPNMGGTVPVPVSLLQGTITQTFPGDNCRYTFTPMSPYPGQTIVSVHVVGASLLDPNIVPTPPTDPAPVTDMLGEQLVFTNTTQFRTAPGPIVANNPTPPYAIYFGALNPNRFGVIAINAVEDAQGSTVGLRTIDSDGDRVARNGEDLLVFPNSENSASIGRVAGIEVGNVITLTNIPVTDPGCYPSPPFPFPTFVTGNTMDNPPLPNPPPRPNINSTSNCAPSLCTFPPVIRPNANNSDLGNFVYVADDVNNVVHVINSTTSLPITQIPTPNPSGLQTDPDMNFLFVTNFSANTMSIIDIRRGSQTQHQVIREVPVGLGPKALTVQPDTEDILVCNQIGNSVSIVKYSTFAVRKTLATLIGPTPWDITSTYRGSTATYFAFITNRDGGNVSVFESGPSTPTFLGPDDVVTVISEGPVASFDIPMGIVSNKSLRAAGIPVLDAPGCLFVCNGNRSLAEIQLTAFQPPPLPNFPSPGELRTFSVVLQTDPTVPGDNPIGLSPTDIALNDNINSCFYLTASNTKAWHRFPPTIPPLLNNCNKVLVANTASGTVSVINRRNGLLIKTIPVPGVNLLEGFFD